MPDEPSDDGYIDHAEQAIGERWALKTERDRLAAAQLTARADTLTEAATAVEAEADRCVGRQHDQYLAGLYGAADLLRTLAATGEPADTGSVTLKDGPADGRTVKLPAWRPRCIAVRLPDDQRAFYTQHAGDGPDVYGHDKRAPLGPHWVPVDLEPADTGEHR